MEPDKEGGLEPPQPYADTALQVAGRCKHSTYIVCLLISDKVHRFHDAYSSLLRDVGPLDILMLLMQVFHVFHHDRQVYICGCSSRNIIAQAQLPPFSTFPHSILQADKKTSLSKYR